jgi:type I restriction enzyme S subunit
VKIGSGATPLGGEQVYLATRHRYALIRSQAVHDHFLDLGALSYITDDDARRLANAEVRIGDVLLNITGDGKTFGRASLAPDEALPACVNQHVSIIRTDPDKLAPGFLLSYLTHPQIKGYIESFNAGGSRRAITKGHIESFVIPLPPLPEQKEISSLFGSINAKLELNRRTNETLEELIRAIFKDWFVDFGPTRAKAEKRDPYLAQELWTLFPGRLDDNDKPQGWKEGRLGDVARSVGESVKPNEMSPETPYIGLEHMPRHSIALNSWEGAGKVTSGKLTFHRGDFLFGKLRPYFHKVGIAPLDGICSTDILVLGPKTPSAAAFVLSCISTDEFVAYTDQTSGGTKMPRTSWEVMARYPLCLPSEQVSQAFQRTVAPMLDRIILNIHESSSLAKTRDVLLPKLMSGEIRLREAEKLVRKVS